MSFSSDLKKFASKTEKNAEKLVRAISLDLFGDVIKLTPVRTGRAKGNWQTDVDAIPSGESDRLDKTGEAALAEARQKVAQFKLGQAIYMVNNLPYIQRLEDGSSKQAPAGMVKRNVSRYQRIVNRQARKLK